MREMSDQSSLVSLLGPLPDQDTSLHFQELSSHAATTALPYSLSSAVLVR